MANNRYFLLCDCGEKQYLGKSLGDGIYNTAGGPQSYTFSRLEGTPILVPEQQPAETASDGQARFLRETYDWMWEHLMGCEHPNAECDPVLGPEWAAGEVFKVVTEYEPNEGSTK